MRVTGGAYCCLLAALAIAGCGGSGTDGTDSSERATIEIDGDTPNDLKIASGLREYLGRGCGRNTPSFSEYRQKLAEGGGEFSPRAIRRYITRRFGSLRYAYLAQTSICQLDSISVSNGVITMSTALNDDRLGRISANEVYCNLIQGSDVADFTAGHRVLSSDGSVLASCPARAG